VVPLLISSSKSSHPSLSAFWLLLNVSDLLNLFNLEYNLIKYELAMVSLNITVDGGAIHSKTCSEQQGEYEGTCALFSYMLYTCS